MAIAKSEIAKRGDLRSQGELTCAV